MEQKKHTDFLSWNIYQIYPRSFLDTNGDGIGDLQGVIAKLDYLKELGIHAIWLGPCFRSPNVDNGYDVSDYRDIMEDFGTLEDMRCLIRQMHERGMKLILDLVPNHTSDQHIWFQESRKGKDNPYSDYYYWYDTPPNSWGSLFGGSAYEFDPVRGQYYLHSYAPQQPDLNWDNPAVVREIQAIVDFWVDMGADGFRIDVIDQISKDFAGDRNCFGPHLHEYIHAVFGREGKEHLFTVGECWTNEEEEIRRHADPARGELSTLFIFDHLDCGRQDKFTPKEDSFASCWAIQSEKARFMQENGLLFSLFTDNHDNNWLLSRLLPDEALRYEAAGCLAAMTYLLPGVAFVYQGQELGMLGSHHDSIQEFDDVESYNYFDELCARMPEAAALEKINFGSRDNTRHPFCWDSSPNAGFTTGKPWMALHSLADQINLEKDLAASKSVWRFYQKLLHLRAESACLAQGIFCPLSGPEDGCAVFRRETDSETLLVICNFEKGQTISHPQGQLLLSNYGHTEKPDDHFAPFEVAVFRL